MDENPYESPEEKFSRQEREFEKRMGRMRIQTIMSVIMLAGLSFAIVMVVGFSLFIAIARICS